MKILAVGDPHGKLPVGLTKIIKRNKVDLIACTGDWAHTPEKPWLEESWKNVNDKFIDRNYKEIVDKVCSYGLPVLTLRGNMLMGGKRKRVADKILRRHKNLVDRFTSKYKIRNKTFIFFDVSFEKSTARNEQKKFYESQSRKNPGRERKLNKLLKENQDSILIAHNPPYGIVDKAYNGKHVGSEILAKAIKKHQPKLVLCGYIHEARGKGKIGKTLVCNLGWHGDYAVLDVDKKVKLIESNFLK